MIKVCKIRIYPNKTQESIIFRTFGACRYIYNLYLSYNQKKYDETKKFLSGYDFAKIVTQLKKNEPNYFWLNNISSKAITDSILNGEKAFKRFFNGITGFPNFKTKKDKVQSYFFIKDNIHFNTGKKNIIKLPILGNVRITERDYLPDKSLITSGRIIYDHNRFFVSFIYTSPLEKNMEVLSYGMGIDVGIEKYATIYYRNGIYTNIDTFLNDEKYIKYNDRIKRLQQVISFKAEENYKPFYHEYMKNHDKEPDNKTKQKNMKEGGCYNTSNIRHLRKALTNAYFKRDNYVKDKINKLVINLVRTKPEYITIEDLSIKKMLEKDSSNTLHDHLAKSNFYYFRTKMEQKCLEYKVELRIANKYFASSKKCSNCGYKNKSLTLTDRVYVCPECKLKIDRDLNAAINLCNLKEDKYTIM